MSTLRCEICPHGCVLKPGQTGFCGARTHTDGDIRAVNYGQITAMALDPIEKKPLYHFHPGSMILSVGSFGCNLRCPFCQNHDISMADSSFAGAVYLSPEALLKRALSVPESIGVAFTYNEPLIGYEYVRDCAALLKQHGQKTVLVTNGYVNEQPLKKLLPLIDAMNIDLKGFTEDYYKTLRGHIEPVKRAIEMASKRGCHVEVTTLIVPGQNDSEDDMRRETEWLSSLNTAMPLHISRFFPRYHMSGEHPTPVKTVYALAKIARRVLDNVYTGNC